jgi:hypothetical protein
MEGKTAILLEAEMKREKESNSAPKRSHNIVSQPGEIRREYEEVQQRLLKEREQQEKASLEAIQRILQEENHQHVITIIASTPETVINLPPIPIHVPRQIPQIVNNTPASTSSTAIRRRNTISSQTKPVIGRLSMQNSRRITEDDDNTDKEEEEVVTIRSKLRPRESIKKVRPDLKPSEMFSSTKGSQKFNSKVKSKFRISFFLKMYFLLLSN